MSNKKKLISDKPNEDEQKQFEIQEFYELYLNYLKDAKDLQQIALLKLLPEQQQSHKEANSEVVNGQEVSPKRFNTNELNIIKTQLIDTINKLIITNKGKCNQIELKTIMEKMEDPKDFENKSYNEINPMAEQPTISSHNNNSMVNLNAIKFENDIDILRTILQSIIDEISNPLFDGTFKELESYIEKSNQEAIDEYNLIIKYIDNNNLVTYLDNKLKSAKTEGERISKELDVEIEKLKDELHDTKIENAMKCELVGSWEDTRQQQTNIVLTDNEQNLIDTCNDYEMKIDREKIVVLEMDNYTKLKCEELEEQIKLWQNKYDIEIKELNINIKQTMDTLSDIDSKYEKMKENYDIRQTVINDYREIQRIENERRLAEEQKYNAAVKIQSWWRGLMVRKQLGPYKLSKKKSKKSKGDKGKKK